MRKFGTLAGLTAALAAVSLAAPASGETVKAFTVGAAISNGCAITANSGGTGTWGDINLGTVVGLFAQSASANVVSNSVAGIQMDCTPGTTANLTAGQGNQPSGGVRQLVHSTIAANKIPYQLYANNSATPWTTQSVPLTFSLGAQHQNFPIKATATLPGPTQAGAYSDVVQVTVAW